jgi:hypothetical protein
MRFGVSSSYRSLGGERPAVARGRLEEEEGKAGGSRADEVEDG